MVDKRGCRTKNSPDKKTHQTKVHLTKAVRRKEEKKKKGGGVVLHTTAQRSQLVSSLINVPSIIINCTGPAQETLDKMTLRYDVGAR